MSNFNHVLRSFEDPDEWRNENWPEYKDLLVLLPHGFFVVRRESDIIGCRPATAADFDNLLFAGVSYQQRHQSRVHLTRKVPYQLLLQAIHFFRSAWQQYKQEDVLLLFYYSEEERYELQHPPLIAAGDIYVEYEEPLTPDEAVRFGSLHSHGSLPADIYSHTDRKDDLKSPGVHVVVGSLDQGAQTVYCVRSDGTHCFPVPLWDIFEQPMWPKFPTDWLAPAPRKQPFSVPPII